MQTQETEAHRPDVIWLVHDLIIGLFSGIGVGTIAGLFVAVRVADNNLITLAGAIVGGAVGILLLLRSHRRHDRFLTPAVVIAWVLLVGSVLFLVALINAIATFD